MIKLILRLVLNALCLYALDYFFPTISFSITGLVIGAVALMLLNGIVKPILNILAIPLKIFTMGLFSFVIDVLILWVILTYVPGASMGSILELIIGGILLSIVNSVLSAVLGL